MIGEGFSRFEICFLPVPRQTPIRVSAFLSARSLLSPGRWHSLRASVDAPHLSPPVVGIDVSSSEVSLALFSGNSPGQSRKLTVNSDLLPVCVPDNACRNLSRHCFGAFHLPMGEQKSHKRKDFFSASPMRIMGTRRSATGTLHLLSGMNDHRGPQKTGLPFDRQGDVP